MVLTRSALLQSNKKEKEAVPTETKKEQEMRPVASESLEKPKLTPSQPQLQPHPPSSSAHSESRRGGKAERGAKRCLKNKQPCDKATTDSVGVKSGGGDDSSTTSKPITVTKGNQQPQEPSFERTISRLPKSAMEATSPSPDRDTDSVKSAAANGKDSHTHPPAGRSPQTQCRDGDNRAERLGTDQEHKPGVAVAAASHTNKTQVREVVTSTFFE